MLAGPAGMIAGALLQAQAQHTTASTRQATYATIRRSGAALMTFPAVGLLQHVPRSRGPASLRTGVPTREYQTGHVGGAVCPEACPHATLAIRNKQ